MSATAAACACGPIGLHLGHSLVPGNASPRPWFQRLFTRCRTEAPQPVSSARRRWSTDPMWLREVGKLAAYLRKMRWLQGPGCRARLRAARRGGVLLGRRPCPSGCGRRSRHGTPPQSLLRGACAGVCCGQRGHYLPLCPGPHSANPAVGGPSRGSHPGACVWLARNCCCAGESDCLIETQLCEGTSWLVSRGDFCPVL